MMIPHQQESEMTQFSVFFHEDHKAQQEIILKFNNTFKEILTGTFPKKTMNMTWTQRFFCLTQTRLIYYQNEKKQQLKGCFNLVSLAQYDLRIQTAYPIITLAISVPMAKHVEQKQLLKLCIQNRKNFFEWRNTLSQQINKEKQNLKLQYPLINLQSVTCPLKNKSNFWNKITISQKQFLSYASHLDILLFRSKSQYLPSFHRFFMRSYYDHVALIIKDEMYRIFVLEAIESRGVWIVQWAQALPTFKSVYEEIGYRKLIMKPDQKINEELLEELLNKLIGKKYELSFKKLLYDSKSQCQQGNTEQKVQKQKTYFCSELIADIYIKLGLIKNKKRNQFWPKDFEEPISLQKGAYLSPIMQIEI